MAKQKSVKRNCIHVALGIGGSVAIVQKIGNDYKVSYFEVLSAGRGWESYPVVIFNRGNSKRPELAAIRHANRTEADSTC